MSRNELIFHEVCRGNKEGESIEPFHVATDELELESASDIFHSYDPVNSSSIVLLSTPEGGDMKALKYFQSLSPYIPFHSPHT